MAIGRSDRFLVNGYNLADYMQSFEPTAEAEPVDATVLSSTYRAYEQGFKTGMIECSGVFDADETNADRIHDVLSAAFDAGTENVVSAGIGAYAVGSDVVMINGCQIAYEMPVEIGELITVSAEFQSSNAINYGKWLVSAAQASGANNGAAVDNAAATTNGGLMHVHLLNDDATDGDVKVQHSTDGSTWADLTGAAVNNLSATHASGSATVAAGTTVNRYLRAVVTVTGGDTFLVSVAFARR